MKRIKLFLSAFVLSLSSVFALVTPHVFAATSTWDGGGSDNNMTTDANWSGDTAPTAGDDLVFPANVTDRTVVNDFSAGTSFNSIVFSGTASSASNYTITGSSMTLVAGINNSMTGSSSTYQDVNLPLVLNGTQTFQTAASELNFGGTLNVSTHALTITPGATGFISHTGVISGSGNITKAGTGTWSVSGASSSYSGTITANAGRIIAEGANALGAASGATTINAGADLMLGTCSSAITVAENITLTGASSNTDTYAKLTAGVGCAGGGGADESYGAGISSSALTLSGNITLGSDITLTPIAATTTLTGALNGNYLIDIDEGYNNKLVINSSPNNSKMQNGEHKSPVKEVTLSDDQATNSVAIFGNTVVTLTGKRGDISVGSGATLKGTGTAGAVTVSGGGTVAPGMSPGCLTVTGLAVAGTFSAEIGGTTACSGYDQTVVNGTVDLNGSTLSTVLYNNFKPSAGQKYVLIANDGTDAVSGTFTGLAQGATFTVSGYTFSISYTGGTGNDVELTVTAVPPDTGFELLTNSPLLTMSLMLGAAGIIAIMARRNFKHAGRKR